MFVCFGCLVLFSMLACYFGLLFAFRGWAFVVLLFMVIAVRCVVRVLLRWV